MVALDCDAFGKRFEMSIDMINNCCEALEPGGFVRSCHSLSRFLLHEAGVFLLPLDGMLVHRRSFPYNLLGFPNNSLYPFIHLGGERHSESNSKVPCSRTQYTVPYQGHVSRKPRKLFGPVEPFLVNLYLKTERCILLKDLVWRELLVILRICKWNSSVIIIRFEIMPRLSGCENFSPGTFEKQAPGLETWIASIRGRAH